MSNCVDKALKIGKLCISYNEYYLIILNILAALFFVTIMYLKKISDYNTNISVIVKNNFTLLGEGAMSNFYSPLNPLQKNPSTKKKVQTRAGQLNATVEKAANNNELKCNSCGRSVEVSYQFTMHKLNN